MSHITKFTKFINFINSIGDIELTRIKFHEVVKTNNKALFEKEIYNKLSVKNQKHHYDPNFIQTEINKNLLFNTNDETINKVVGMLKNPSIECSSLIKSNKDNLGLYQKYKVIMI